MVEPAPPRPDACAAGPRRPSPASSPCDAAPRRQQATFTARVDAVRVDVDVRRGNKPVTGLSAADFEVLDNGVPQRVELVSPTALPLNVVLALDGSASLDAPRARPT